MRSLAGIMRLVTVLILLSAALAASMGTALSDDGVDQRRKIALVLGLGGYRAAERLTNPINDAVLIATRLKAAGFTITQAYDSTQAELTAAVDQFVAAAQGVDIAVVYFSGHALQIRAENYLMPIDFDPAAADLAAGLIPVSGLLARLSTAAKARVLLLDACRDNPFAAAVAERLGREATGRGLAAINIPVSDGTSLPDGTHGLVIGYATQPNQTAADGDARSGPYAKALAEALRSPDEDINAILLRTAFSVVNDTRGGQHPEHRIALTQPLHLVARKAPLRCDVLAADEFNNVGVKAVPFDELVGGEALEACQQDLARAPNNPRLIHNLGRVLDKIGRDTEAVAQYRRAAEAGFAPSQNSLAVLLMNGEGVERDMVAALGWLARATAQGFPPAIANFGADMAMIFRNRSDRVLVLQRGLQRAGAAGLQATGKLDEETLAALDRLKSDRGHKGARISLQTLHELAIAAELMRI